MKEIKIAIISKNKALTRFFEIEALNFGICASVFDKMPCDISSFPLTIIDVDTVKLISSVDIDKTILVSQDYEYKTSVNGARAISWPASVNFVRDIYESVKYGALLHVTDSDTVKKDTDKIYFYKKAKNTVRYGNRNILLSDCEMRLLETLCKNAYEAVEREALNRALGVRDGNMADVYVCKLRKKLEPSSGERVIFTVRSKGYKIMASMEWE